MEDRKKALLFGLAAAGGYLAARSAVRWRRAYDFRGKIALVTGGSRGLGLELARELAREGARIVLSARDEDELERAKAQLSELGAEVMTVPCDVTDQGQVERMMRHVGDAWGPVDVLINNAGVIQTGPMESMTLDDYETAMKTHFWGPLYAIQAALPEMQRRGGGRIVNIASIGGKVSIPHLLPYCASKFALVGLSEGLRAALLKYGILVTTVCPGLMRTGSPRHAKIKGQHEKEYALFKLADSLPLLTISAESAARQILDACRFGEAEVILSVPAEVGVLIHGLFPGLTADLLGWVNTLLPEPGPDGQENRTGAESESAASESPLTQLTDRAAARNNEV